jgi:hypothetical protein
MTLALYGILVVLALFIVLMVFNPNLSCFGRRLRSPIYPLLRRKKQKRMQTTDYGFDLGEPLQKGNARGKQRLRNAAAPEDYGFNLGGKRKERSTQALAKSEKLFAEDYGFDLRETPQKKENQDINDSDKKTE